MVSPGLITVSAFACNCNSQIAATLPASGEPTAGWTHVAYYVQSPFPALASG